MCRFEETLNKFLQASGVDKMPAYTTSATAKILSISPSMVIYLCDEWQPPDQSKKNRGLECYRAGTHRRIPHHAIIEWLENNFEYNLLGEN
mgnify:FL=1